MCQQGALFRAHQEKHSHQEPPPQGYLHLWKVLVILPKVIPIPTFSATSSRQSGLCPLASNQHLSLFDFHHYFYRHLICSCLCLGGGGLNYWPFIYHYLMLFIHFYLFIVHLHFFHALSSKMQVPSSQGSRLSYSLLHLRTQHTLPTQEQRDPIWRHQTCSNHLDLLRLAGTHPQVNRGQKAMNPL